MRTIALFAAATLAAPALAQSNIDRDRNVSWGENIGFMNWSDADGGSQGIGVSRTFLSGFIWGEDIGWVNAGSGPADGVEYANDASADKGVNIDPSTGELFGFAWGENAGWINFDTRAALSPFGQQAMYDNSAARFRGYAWGENLGWINLDDASVVVGVCRGDITTTGTGDGDPGFGSADGAVNLSDLLFFVNVWDADLGSPTPNPGSIADVTTTGASPGVPDGSVDLSDLLYFLNEWTLGVGDCP